MTTSAPILKNIDAVLNNPGIFAFQIEDDGTFKFGKNKYLFNSSVIQTIKTFILDVFKNIVEQLKYYEHQSPSYLSQIIAKLSKFVGNHRFNFPGLQVINISREILNFFSHMANRFLICEKSDGVRYLMLHFANGVNMFIGRNLEFFQVKFTEKLGQTDNPNNWKIVHFLDGELIVDDVHGNSYNNNGNEVLIGGSLKKVKFLVFDAIVINEENIGALPFKKRLELLSKLFKGMEFARYAKNTSHQFISKFKSEIQSTGFISENSLYNDINLLFSSRNEGHLVNSLSSVQQSFTFLIELYMKDYFTLDNVRTLYPLTKKLPHHNDGIIINTDDYPYYSGQSTEIFKWKPVDMNTIDFEVEYNEKVGGFELKVKDRMDMPTVDMLFFNGEEDITKKEFDAGYVQNIPNIAECFYDKDYNIDAIIIFNFTLEKFGGDVRKAIANYNRGMLVDEEMRRKFSRGGWRFMRFRNDKGKANAITTYKNILQTIEENIVIEDLFAEVDANKDKPLPELKEANDFISACVWAKFYRVKKEEIDEIQNEPPVDPLMSNLNNILKEKRGREKNPFTVNSNSKKEMKVVKEKKEMKTKKEIQKEKKEKETKNRCENFSESLGLLTGVVSSPVNNAINAMRNKEEEEPAPFSRNEQSISFSSDSSDSDKF